MTDRATSTPAPCPHCGYDLGQVAGDLCPNCGGRVAWRDGAIVATVRWPAFLRSLLLRTLIALPLGLAALCASIWLSRIFGSAKLQTTPAIILGVVFGYGYGFGLADRAGRVNALVFSMVTLFITAIAAADVAGVLMLLPDLAADAGPKRFWFAAGAFGGTTIMCALIALRVESRTTVLLR